MSVTTTLVQLQGVLQQALGGSVPVYTTLQTVPYRGSYPFVALTEYKQVVSKELSGLKGNPFGVPNIYSFAYVQRNLTQSGLTIAAAVAELRNNIELIIQAFSSPRNSALNDQVMIAGEYIQIDYDRHGPYINYMGADYIGCFGMISVVELYRPDVTP